MTAYYNENDPFAAQWLRELIKAGHIAPGDVDERSIEDVRPNDLARYVQCHFFAGIGVWSYALRRAGWSDDRPVWTGSCPCQPFSTAGKGGGFADERHLWPAWDWLIDECRPPKIIGEQVASKDAEPWIDLVQSDLESMGYAFGCIAFPAASIGAPHIRDRAYWVADSQRSGFSGLLRPVNIVVSKGREETGWDFDAGIMGTSYRPWETSTGRDGKIRLMPSDVVAQPHGASARVGRLRGYGNAINAEQAQTFIEAIM